MNLKARFKPRAEALLLSRLVQKAWENYQDQFASKERQAEVAESIARYFENAIPANELEILKKYNCVAWQDHCNVQVYDAEGDSLARYREAFSIKLPRKVPCVGNGGYGYPSMVACEPDSLCKESANRTPPVPRELDGFFINLLKARKQYQTEYKASANWPYSYSVENGGKYPTWEEIAEKFPVLGAWLKNPDREIAA